MKPAHAASLAVVGAVIAFFAFAPKLLTGVSIQASWRAANPERAALQDRLSAQQSSLRTLRNVRERLVAMEAAQRLPRTTAMISVSSDVRTPAARRALFEQRFRSDLASIGDSVRYPIRMHVVTDSLSVGAYDLFAVLPRSAGEPCTLVVLTSGNANVDVRPTAGERIIGPCGFYATFGPAGPGMTQWLLATRGIHATTDLASPSTPPKEGKHRIAGGDLVRAPEAAGCSAGVDSLCVRAWSGARWMLNMIGRDTLYREATTGVVRINRFGTNYVPSRNLSDLRVAMTDARFAELWRSDKAPMLAYEEIEGRSIAAFARDRLHEEVEPHRPGPLHAGLPLMLSLAVAAGCVAVTLRFTARRRS